MKKSVFVEQYLAESKNHERKILLIDRFSLPVEGGRFAGLTAEMICLPDEDKLEVRVTFPIRVNRNETGVLARRLEEINTQLRGFEAFQLHALEGTIVYRMISELPKSKEAVDTVVHHALKTIKLFENALLKAVMKSYRDMTESRINDAYIYKFSTNTPSVLDRVIDRMLSSLGFQKKAEEPAEEDEPMVPFDEEEGAFHPEPEDEDEAKHDEDEGGM